MNALKLEGLHPEIRLTAPLTEWDLSGTVSFKVDFSFPDLFLESITLDALRFAYSSYDRRIRIRYTIKLKKALAIGSKTLREIAFSKKWVLYWTRDPSILEKFGTNIWVLGVNKDGYAEFFNDFDEAKRFLFKLSELVTVTANELGRGVSRVYASVEAKIWRHTFSEPGTLKARSNIISVRVV